MKTTKLRWTRDKDGTWLCALVPEREAMYALENFEEGKEYTVEIKKSIKKRSLDANSYFWELVGKLAAYYRLPVSEIYRKYVREVGGNTIHLCMMKGALETFAHKWEKNGLGWQVQTFQSKIEGCINVIAYYGSSEFNTEEMSRLIDMVVQDCEDAGIETLPPYRIENLKEDWGNKTCGNDDASYAAETAQVTG